MKTPIKPEDIREGDLIRTEKNSDTETAFEFRWHEFSVASLNCTYYLLDRPPVLPNEPTLGYLHWQSRHGAKGASTVLAKWALKDDDFVWSDLGHGIDRTIVRGFSEIVAVPREVLDELRGVYPGLAIDYIRTFLAAVDEANA